MADAISDVIVVGAGPCGVTLAHHLGMYGVRAVVFDAAAGILDYPRAVGMDDEALRSYQTVGIADRLIADMIQSAPVRYHNSAGRCFAAVNPQDQPFGWPRRNMFLQPLTEATLREGLAKYPNLKVLLKHEVTDLSQDKDGVDVVVQSDGGQKTTWRAKYVVGADGGRSIVRKAIGVDMLGRTNEWRWLVIDVENDERYAPFSGVYCHPKRPHMSIDLPYGFRRFEFRLLPEERDEDMQQPEAVQRLLAPHYPVGAIPKVKRSRIYLHHSRTAERFQVGRVFLAGDAAHLQPPFFGQGMNSGLRDATNLGWKLAAVIAGKANPAMLVSYDRERRDHASKMVNFATAIGSFYAPKNYVTEAFRNIFFRLVQGLPNARDYVLQMKFKPLPRYLDGVVIHQNPIDKRSPIGRMFVQPIVETLDHRRVKLDDAIGNWFAIIGLRKDPAEYLSAEERGFWKENGARLVMIAKSRSAPQAYRASPDTLVLDDVTGAFRDFGMARKQDEFIILRPDRYVAAICNAQNLNTVSRKLRAILMGSAQVALHPQQESPAEPSLVSVAT